jgi:hypothetical protein
MVFPAQAAAIDNLERYVTGDYPVISQGASNRDEDRLIALARYEPDFASLHVNVRPRERREIPGAILFHKVVSSYDPFRRRLLGRIRRFVPIWRRKKGD